MMYPFLTLDDGTEIVHSEMHPDGSVKVYMEKPDAKDGFHHAVCWLPDYRRISPALPGRSWSGVRRSSARPPTSSSALPRKGALTMPQIFKIGSYWVYFWSNEGDPLEPVHVHVAQGAPTSNATKIWITSAGGCYVCNNNSRIPERTLRNITAILEARSGEIIAKWRNYFGQTKFYC